MAGLETKVTASINSSWTHNPGVCLLTPVMQAETCLQSAPATQLAFFCMLNTLLLTCNIPFACCEHPWYVCCLRCAHNHVELVRDAICTAMVQGNVQAQQPESSFPAMQPADAVRYQSMFQQMDNDRDGYVQASCLVTGQSASPFSCSNKCGCVCSQLQQEVSTLVSQRPQFAACLHQTTMGLAALVGTHDEYIHKSTQRQHSSWRCCAVIVCMLAAAKKQFMWLACCRGPSALHFVCREVIALEPSCSGACQKEL